MKTHAGRCLPHAPRILLVWAAWMAMQTTDHMVLGAKRSRKSTAHSNLSKQFSELQAKLATEWGYPEKYINGSEDGCGRAAGVISKAREAGVQPAMIVEVVASVLFQKYYEVEGLPQNTGMDSPGR